MFRFRRHNNDGSASVSEKTVSLFGRARCWWMVADGGDGHDRRKMRHCVRARGGDWGVIRARANRAIATVHCEHSLSNWWFGAGCGAGLRAASCGCDQLARTLLRAGSCGCVSLRGRASTTSSKAIARAYVCGAHVAADLAQQIGSARGSAPPICGAEYTLPARRCRCRALARRAAKLSHATVHVLGEVRATVLVFIGCNSRQCVDKITPLRRRGRLDWRARRQLSIVRIRAQMNGT